MPKDWNFPLGSRWHWERATLYFLLRYRGGVNDSEMSADRLPVVLEWARSAPPSEYERHRNAAIYAAQGNRNPLIDHLEGLDRIDFSRGIGSWSSRAACRKVPLFRRAAGARSKIKISLRAAKKGLQTAGLTVKFQFGCLHQNQLI